MPDFLWWRDGVIYQIYPRSFQDSNADGIGDLAGITDRLDYLQDLGIDAIWLSPIYPSPDVDFGYDVSDYCNVHPQFGSMKDFDRFVKEARSRKIHIIMDLVLNHTSDQHPWFIESRKSPNGPYADFYLWRKGKPGNKPPNNWLSVFGGPGWEFDPCRGEYFFHMFYKQQPDLNWQNEQVQEKMLDIFRFWADRGVDGFRLDVFNAFFKDKDFKDNPKTLLGIRPFDRMRHLYDIDQPELIKFIQRLRKMLEKYPESYVVGETFLDGYKKAAEYCVPGLLHAAFNFDFINTIWRADFFKDRIFEWQSALHPDTWPSLVLNNHDNPRSATRFGKREDDARMKVAAAMLLTLRGTPFLYAGEEIGMRDIRISREEVQDPIGKYYWPFFKGRDGCRTPMQWDNSANSGFSTVQPWLRVHENYPERNVFAQQSDPSSLLNFYKQLLSIRRAIPALHSGTFEMLSLSDGDVLGYQRKSANSGVIVLLNFKSSTKQIKLPAFTGQARVVLSSHARPDICEIETGIQLGSDEALILEMTQEKIV